MASPKIQTIQTFVRYSLIFHLSWSLNAYTAIISVTKFIIIRLVYEIRRNTKVELAPKWVELAPKWVEYALVNL